MDTAEETKLEPGPCIRVLTSPYFIATKLETLQADAVEIRQAITTSRTY